MYKQGLPIKVLLHTDEEFPETLEIEPTIGRIQRVIDITKFHFLELVALEARVHVRVAVDAVSMQGYGGKGIFLLANDECGKRNFSWHRTAPESDTWKPNPWLYLLFQRNGVITVDVYQDDPAYTTPRRVTFMYMDRR